MRATGHYGIIFSKSHDFFSSTKIPFSYLTTSINSYKAKQHMKEKKYMLKKICSKSHVPLSLKLILTIGIVP